MGLFIFTNLCCITQNMMQSDEYFKNGFIPPPKKQCYLHSYLQLRDFFFFFQNNLQQRFPALKKQKQKRKGRKRISTSSNIKQKKNVKITYVMCRWAGVKGKSVDIIPLVWQSLDYKKNSPILPPNFFFFFLRSSHLNHLILSPSSLPL